MLTEEWARFADAYQIQRREVVGGTGWDLDGWNPGEGGWLWSVCEYNDDEPGEVYCPRFTMGERRLSTREMFECLRFGRMMRGAIT